MRGGRPFARVTLAPPTSPRIQEPGGNGAAPCVRTDQSDREKASILRGFYVVRPSPSRADGPPQNHPVVSEHRSSKFSSEPIESGSSRCRTVPLDAKSKRFGLVIPCVMGILPVPNNFGPLVPSPHHELD